MFQRGPKTHSIFKHWSAYCIHNLTVVMYTPPYCGYVYTTLLWLRIHHLTVVTYTPPYCGYVYTTLLWLRIHHLTVVTYTPPYCGYVYTTLLWLRIHHLTVVMYTPPYCGVYSSTLTALMPENCWTICKAQAMKSGGRRLTSIRTCFKVKDWVAPVALSSWCSVSISSISALVSSDIR